MNDRRVVVITGGSTGIGEACALHLDSLGFTVFAGVRRQVDGDALKSKGSSRLQPVTLDVTDTETIHAAADLVKQQFPAGLAGLVNNAGIVVAAPLEFVPLDDLRKQFEVNVVGQIATTQAFLPLLREARGRVINIGSIGGRVSGPFVGPYSASKFAMEALTDSLRIELIPWGIEVSIVEPGNIRTPIWDKSRESADERRADAPEEMESLYREEIKAMYEYSKKQAISGIPALEVAKVVAEAITARKPKTRYVVGSDAKLQAYIAQRLPDRLRDSLILRELGLRKARRPIS